MSAVEQRRNREHLSLNEQTKHKPGSRSNRRGNRDRGNSSQSWPASLDTVITSSDASPERVTGMEQSSWSSCHRAFAGSKGRCRTSRALPRLRAGCLHIDTPRRCGRRPWANRMRSKRNAAALQECGGLLKQLCAARASLLIGLATRCCAWVCCTLADVHTQDSGLGGRGRKGRFVEPGEELD